MFLNLMLILGEKRDRDLVDVKKIKCSKRRRHFFLFRFLLFLPNVKCENAQVSEIFSALYAHAEISSSTRFKYLLHADDF